jgi:peptidoglycan hydrolase CwlO-like protein
MNIIELAKAHLQNVFTKIQELEQNKQAIESEIEKLKNYASKGLEVVQQEEKNFDKK